MGNKLILVLSIIVLFAICFTFFNYVHYLPTNTYENASDRMKVLYNKGSFDDVINMRFYTAVAVFLVASAVPLTFILSIAKHTIKREPIN